MFSEHPNFKEYSGHQDPDRVAGWQGEYCQWPEEHCNIKSLASRIKKWQRFPHAACWRWSIKIFFPPSTGCGSRYSRRLRFGMLAYLRNWPPYPPPHLDIPKTKLNPILQGGGNKNLVLKSKDFSSWRYPTEVLNDLKEVWINHKTRFRF